MAPHGSLKAHDRESWACGALGGRLASTRPMELRAPLLAELAHDGRECDEIEAAIVRRTDRRAEGVDLGAGERPRRPGRLWYVVRLYCLDHEERATLADHVRDVGGRLCANRSRHGLHGKDLDDEVERARPLGRRFEQ